MEIKIANVTDCLKASEMLYSSGMELYDYLYKTKNTQAIDFIKYEFMSGKGLCGVNNVYGLYENNNIIGTSCFFDEDNYTQISYQTLCNVLRYYSFFDIVPMIYRLLKIEGVMRKPKKGEIYLSNFAIERNKRGKGYGSSFIKDTIRKYKNMGYTIFGLDVDLNNGNAKKLYTKFGFIEKDTKLIQIKHNNKVDKININKMELFLL